MPRRRNVLVLLAILIQIFVILTFYIEPIALVNRSRLNISGTVKERLSIVIVSNRADNIRELKERADFSPVEPYSLEGRTDIDLSGSGENIIKQLYLAALNQCDKVYCMLVEDDVVFIYKEIKDVLFDNLLSYNNDNNYIFDCSKKGFLRKNYKPNGNGTICRIYSRYAVRAMKECLPKCDKPADVCVEECLENFEEKRFLLAQHAGYKSSRWS
ncbi:hypothetical protein BGW38_000974 [Lunasporangiospora selenospora]|uniref:Uncharacterized protein n=1 Tax=Lunasporangiospora selenospora TaxID=979761 RepID=A0A9P6FUV0_9FUNG|nr:hypothetical protein BGW38_000974 [Lunasporangiospora selenospora]